MSVRALTWSFNLILPDMAAKAVLNALADHADESGRCWPSMARLALYAGCEEKTVRRALVRLVAFGLIEREARAGRSDVYRLSLDAALPVEDPSQKPPLPKTTPPNEGSTPDFEAHTPPHVGTRTIRNRQKNRQEPSKRTTRSADDERFKLPPDYRASADDRNYASDKGLDPETSFARFLDHFTEGKGRNEKRTSDGWSRRLRIWFDTDAKWAAAPRSGPGFRSPVDGGDVGAFARAAALLGGGKLV